MKNYDEALKWYFVTLFLFNTLLNYIIISYNQAIQLNPKHFNACFNKGALLKDLGR